MPYNPYNSIRRSKYYEVHELLLVECDKDSQFFGQSETKLAIILVLVHVNVLDLMLLRAMILYRDIVRNAEEACSNFVYTHFSNGRGSINNIIGCSCSSQ